MRYEVDTFKFIHFILVEVSKYIQFQLTVFAHTFYITSFAELSYAATFRNSASFFSKEAILAFLCFSLYSSMLTGINGTLYRTIL